MKISSTIAFVFALLLSAPTQAGNVSGLRVSLQCDDTSTAMATCKAVKKALSDKLNAPQIFLTSELDKSRHFDLKIRLELTHQETDMLAGRLIWMSDGEAAVTGPEVEVSSFDAPLSSKAPNDLASGLLQVSDLPI